jgi:hypothetical protein
MTFRAMCAQLRECVHFCTLPLLCWPVSCMAPVLGAGVIGVMSTFGIELGVTDYLHEIELWRQRLKAWEVTLPWPEGAAAALCVEALLELSDEATFFCRLVRQRMGYEECIPDTIGACHGLEELETVIGLSIWKIMRQEERLLEAVPPDAAPPPCGLPRARLRIRG